MNIHEEIEDIRSEIGKLRDRVRALELTSDFREAHKESLAGGLTCIMVMLSHARDCEDGIREMLENARTAHRIRIPPTPAP